MDLNAIDVLINELDDTDLFKIALLKSIHIIESALEQYELKSIAISFNGGKDACVIFHLVRYVLWKRDQLTNGFGNNNLNQNAIKIVCK